MNTNLFSGKFHATEFYAEHKDRSFFPELIDYMTSGSVIAMELINQDAVSAWRKTLGKIPARF